MGGQFYRGISKFGYINNLQKILKINKFTAIKNLNICDGKLIQSKTGFIGKTYNVIQNNNAYGLNYFSLYIKTQEKFTGYMVDLN